MSERTTRTTIIFHHPWMLPGADETMPAGTYVVETDEEQIPGLSFTAYRRIRTSLIVPVAFGSASGRQVMEVDPEQLAAALARDAAASIAQGVI